jgi:hypothetical protein
MYISHNKEKRSISNLKDSFMRNKFDHLNFSSFLESKSGKKYYLGLNSKSEAREVAESAAKVPEHLQDEDFVEALAKRHYKMSLQ